MKKTLLIFTFVLTFFSISCGRTDKKNTAENVEISKIMVDTSAIAIMKVDSSTSYVFGFLEDFNYPELTMSDLEKIEIILLNFTKDYNIEHEKEYEELTAKYPDVEFDKNHFNIDLSQYKRQYYANINEKGEKEVWINCFCNGWLENWQENLQEILPTNWRKDLIIVKDGGNCFFNLKINLDTEKYYDVMINGHA